MMTTDGTETSHGSFAANPAWGGWADSSTSAAATMSCGVAGRKRDASAVKKPY